MNTKDVLEDLKKVWRGGRIFVCEAVRGTQVWGLGVLQTVLYCAAGGSDFEKHFFVTISMLWQIVMDDNFKIAQLNVAYYLVAWPQIILTVILKSRFARL